MCCLPFPDRDRHSCVVRCVGFLTGNVLTVGCPATPLPPTPHCQECTDYTPAQRAKACNRSYSQALREDRRISAGDAAEMLDLVMRQASHHWVLAKWLAEDKLECSEELGDLVSLHDSGLGERVRRRAANAAATTATTANITAPSTPPPPPPGTSGGASPADTAAIPATAGNSTGITVDLPLLQTNHKRKDRSAPAAVTRSPVTTPIDSEPMNWDDVGVVRRSSASSSSTRSEVALASVPGSASAETFRRKHTETPTNNDDDAEESPPKRIRIGTPYTIEMFRQYSNCECDEALVAVCQDNGLFKELAKYLITSMDMELWDSVLMVAEGAEETAARRALIDEVVQTAVAESTIPDEVSTTVAAFMNADMTEALTELLGGIRMTTDQLAFLRSTRTVPNMLVLLAMRAMLLAAELANVEQAGALSAKTVVEQQARLQDAEKKLKVYINPLSYIHTHIHIYIYTHIYTHTHIHTRAYIYIYI